jgi:hypothetical protein
MVLHFNCPSRSSIWRILDAVAFVEATSHLEAVAICRIEQLVDDTAVFEARGIAVERHVHSIRCATGSQSWSLKSAVAGVVCLGCLGLDGSVASLKLALAWTAVGLLNTARCYNCWALDSVRYLEQWTHHLELFSPSSETS